MVMKDNWRAVTATFLGEGHDPMSISRTSPLCPANSSRNHPAFVGGPIDRVASAMDTHTPENWYHKRWTPEKTCLMWTKRFKEEMSF